MNFRIHAFAVHGIAVASLFVLAQSRPASADPGSCKTDIAPQPQPTEFPLLYPPRHDELTLEAAYVASSLPLRSAFESTLMYSFAPFDQRLHVGARVGFVSGDWGADERGPVALGLGARVALDVWRPLSGILGVYALAQADVLLLAERGDDVLRPAIGAGVRVARAVGLEATFEPLISLGSPFAKGDSIAGGFGLGLSFDFCGIGGWCNETGPTTADVDLTPALYDAAAGITPTDPATHAVLCQAVEAALDPGHYAPHDDIDATEAFLRGLAENVTEPVLRAKLAALTAQHRALRQKLLASRNAARGAAAQDRVLAEHCLYSPLAVELRSQLGCDPASR